MRKVSILGKTIGLKKTFQVPVTVGLMDDIEEWEVRFKEIEIASLQKQIKQEATDDEAELTIEEQLANAKQEVSDIGKSRQQRLDMINFLAKVLKLTDEQVETVKNSTDDTDLGQFFSYISLRARGISETEFNQIIKAQREMSEEDPKK